MYYLLTGTSATQLDPRGLFNELPWTLKLKILNHTNITPQPDELVDEWRVGMKPVQLQARNQRIGMEPVQPGAPNRRVGTEALIAKRRKRKDYNVAKRQQTEESKDVEDPSPPQELATDDDKMRMKLFSLMYETVRENDLKVKRVELIQDYYKNSTLFKIGCLIGDVNDKYKNMIDISTTLNSFYKNWTPIEHVNAYEQIANQAIEISDLIEQIKQATMRMNPDNDKTSHATAGLVWQN